MSTNTVARRLSPARIQRYAERMREISAKRKTEGGTQQVLLADRVLWAIGSGKPAVEKLPTLPRRITAEWMESAVSEWWWISGLDPEYLEAGKLTQEQRAALVKYLETVGPMMTEMAANLERMAGDFSHVAEVAD